MSTFHVDLRGVVDLLSHHLYSSPRVYVRELLQNGVDAITARTQLDPGAPRRIRIEPPTVTGDGTLRVRDTGVGLTAAEMTELLATIGRSSKRDEYDFARGEFLGQFGIGLLSCFLVADEIVVRSRSARTADAETVVWRGRADGTYDIGSSADPLTEPGTEVTLVPRGDDAAWLHEDTVLRLAQLYGSLLPPGIELHTGGSGVQAVSGQTPPWRMTDTAERDRYCEDVFGFRPLDTIPLDLPLAGVHGVAFVLPMPANPAEPGGHRVYLKQMLLAESAEGLLPSWAFFVRCAVDSTGLRPTASRESLYEDALLDETREILGQQVREWLLRLASVNPVGMSRFLQVHHLGVKAIAAHDDDMLQLVRDHVPFETSLGAVTLSEFARSFPHVRYSRTVDEFRSLSAVASAQGYGLVNAGYAFDEPILQRLAETGALEIAPLDAGELTARMDVVSAHDELLALPLLRAATAALAGRPCEVVLRHFDPFTMPALYLPDPHADRGTIASTAEQDADPFWAGVLGAFAAGPKPQSQFVLNHASPLVRKLVGIGDNPLSREVVAGLYVQALLQGRHPMQPADTALLNSSFLALIDRALVDRAPDDRDRGGPTG